MHEKTVMSTKVGFHHENNTAFMRSGDLSTRSRNPSDNALQNHMQRNTGYSNNNNALKIEGSPLGRKSKESHMATPLLPPMKAPSRTYAY